jgi:hypothetical protein
MCGHKPGPDKIKIEFDHVPMPFSGVAVSIVDRKIQYSTPANLCLYRIAFTRLVILNNIATMTTTMQLSCPTVYTGIPETRGFTENRCYPTPEVISKLIGLDWLKEPYVICSSTAQDSSG